MGSHARPEKLGTDVTRARMAPDHGLAVSHVRA
jgi:hypothetical protein